MMGLWVHIPSSPRIKFPPLTPKTENEGLPQKWRWGLQDKNQDSYPASQYREGRERNPMDLLIHLWYMPNIGSSSDKVVAKRFLRRHRNVYSPIMISVPDIDMKLCRRIGRHRPHPTNRKCVQGSPKRYSERIPRLPSIYVHHSG